MQILASNVRLLPLHYYGAHAPEAAGSYELIDFSGVLARFAKFVPAGARVLEVVINDTYFSR